MERATRWVLMALAAQKVIQHGVVTWALAFDKWALHPDQPGKQPDQASLDT